MAFNRRACIQRTGCRSALLFRLRLLEEGTPVVEAFFDALFVAVFAGLVVAAAFGEVGLRDVGAFAVVAAQEK